MCCFWRPHKRREGGPWAGERQALRAMSTDLVAKGFAEQEERRLKKTFCSETRPQTVTNFMHGLFGTINSSAGGGLAYLGINAITLGKAAVSLSVVSFAPLAAIAIGVALLAIGLSLLGLLGRDLYNNYYLRPIIRNKL